MKDVDLSITEVTRGGICSRILTEVQQQKKERLSFRLPLGYRI